MRGDALFTGFLPTEQTHRPLHAMLWDDKILMMKTALVGTDDGDVDHLFSLMILIMVMQMLLMVMAIVIVMVMKSP